MKTSGMVSHTMLRGKYKGKTIEVRQEWHECIEQEHWYQESSEDKPTIEGWYIPGGYDRNFKVLMDELEKKYG